MVSNICLFSPRELGKIPILTSIFFPLGWSQLDSDSFLVQWSSWSFSESSGYILDLCRSVGDTEAMAKLVGSFGPWKWKEQEIRGLEQEKNENKMKQPRWHGGKVVPYIVLHMYVYIFIYLFIFIFLYIYLHISIYTPFFSWKTEEQILQLRKLRNQPTNQWLRTNQLAEVITPTRLSAFVAP